MTIRSDVIVVGGGLLGCAVSWMLARDGVDVRLIERDQINQHASGQNAGSLHLQLEYRMVEGGIENARKAAEAMPLHLDAARMWASAGDELGESVGLLQTGGLMLAETAEQAAILEQKAALERSWGLDVEVLNTAETREIAPYLSDSIIAAAYCPSEGKADARTAAPAYARAAARHGAKIHTRTKVVTIKREGGRWVLEADAERADGRTERLAYEAEAVILAPGVWTTELGEILGTKLPTIALALTMTVTLKTAKFIPHLVQHAGARLSLKQSADGNVLIGGGWPARLPTDNLGRPDFEARPELLRASVAGNARAAIAAVPRIASLPALRTWVGTTTVTPDQLPLVGPILGFPGVFVATGGSAFTLGPSFARVLSELAQGRPSDIDLSPYAPDRYGDPSYD